MSRPSRSWPLSDNISAPGEYTVVSLGLIGRFFEWDASLVRDGTYYAAMLLAKHNGSDDDIACCVQALNELRWAHAKAWSRSAE